MAPPGCEVEDAELASRTEALGLTLDARRVLLTCAARGQTHASPIIDAMVASLSPPTVLVSLRGDSCAFRALQLSRRVALCELTESADGQELSPAARSGTDGCPIPHGTNRALEGAVVRWMPAGRSDVAVMIRVTRA